MERVTPSFLPVFLWIGFLGSGKTTLINALIENGSVARVKTLFLVTEEGETSIPEYDWLTVYNIDSLDSVDRDSLSSLQKAVGARQILIEYNGMWKLEDLYSAIPLNWIVDQVFLTADTEEFLIYNNNIRALTADKLKVSTHVIFNRLNENADTSVLRRLVRALNRKADIFYETEEDMWKDEDPDQLPYDLSCDSFIVEDGVYALWQLDMRSFPMKYHGKTVTFSGRLFDKNSSNPQIGRRVMTCCEADMEWILFDITSTDCELPASSWGAMTARINVSKDNSLSLHALSFDVLPAPASEIAVF